MNENLKNYVYFLMDLPNMELNLEMYKGLTDILYHGRNYNPENVHRYVSKMYLDVPTFEQFVRERTIISIFPELFGIDPKN
jgi:hypothetical protein